MSEGSVQMLTAEWRDNAIEQLKDNAVFKPDEVVCDQTSAFILTLSAPETDASAVLVVCLCHGFNDRLGPLPAKLLPQVDLNDKDYR